MKTKLLILFALVALNNPLVADDTNASASSCFTGNVSNQECLIMQESHNMSTLMNDYISIIAVEKVTSQWQKVLAATEIEMESRDLHSERMPENSDWIMRELRERKAHAKKQKRNEQSFPLSVGLLQR